jgi:aspartyl-tRNA(Asn)/glutamyl-tRNA(Gln) amidotransferase subunit B
MISAETRAKYLPTIGIECHVQLKTKTKLFSGANNDAREAAPNTMISPLCIGLPGTLPVLNKEAVNLAIKAGHALNAKVNAYSKFDRKHYFYPDLPLGYQITQFDEPIIGEGEIETRLADGTPHTVRIERAHLEADAGKLNHPDGKDYSIVDLNRAGTPLLEVVSKPDMHTAAEAKAYAKELYLRMKYAEVSDVNLFYGNMRFDVNISIAPTDATELGTRAEIKNLNSFRAVEKAVEYEVARQIELVEKGQKIVQETRGWDDAKQRTFSQRSKEDAHDYRYFPDPDLPPVQLEQAVIDAARDKMPTLPNEIRDSLSAIKLDYSQIETLVDEPVAAAIVTGFLDQNMTSIAQKVANWLTGDVQRAVVDNEFSWESSAILPTDLADLAGMVEANKLSSTAAKEVLQAFMRGETGAEKIAEAKNLLQVSDSGELETAVAAVLKDNPKAAQDIVDGEMKAIGFLVGQVMKSTGGKANPQMVQSIIKKQLGV